METKKILYIIGGIAVVGGVVYYMNKKNKSTETKSLEPQEEVTKGEVENANSVEVIEKPKNVTKRPDNRNKNAVKVNSVSKPRGISNVFSQQLKPNIGSTSNQQLKPNIGSTGSYSKPQTTLSPQQLMIKICGNKPSKQSDLAIWAKCAKKVGEDYKNGTIQESQFSGFKGEDLFSNFNNEFDL